MIQAALVCIGYSILNRGEWKGPVKKNVQALGCGLHALQP